MPTQNILFILILLFAMVLPKELHAQFRHDRLERAVYQSGPYIKFKGKTSALHSKSFTYLNYMAEVLKTDYTTRKLVLGVRGKTIEVIEKRIEEINTALTKVYKIPPNRYELTVCLDYKRKRDDPWLSHSKHINFGIE